MQKLTLMSILISLFSFCFHSALGQKNQLDYNFINYALHQVDKYDTTYFLLQERTYHCYLTENDIDELKEYLNTKVLNEIKDNSQLKTNNVTEFDKGLLAVSGLYLITASKIDSLQKIADNTTPLNKRIFYICSLPVFSNDKNYAIIDFGGGTKRLQMQGKKYLFKKIKNKWSLIATFGYWAS